MRYYKQTDSGYIIAIGTGLGGTEITEDEYNTILSAIRAKPKAVGTTDYRLRDDLTWEAYEIEPVTEDTELTDDEALEILMGGKA